MSQRDIPDSPIALISKAELADALGVSTWTLDDWLRKGKLPRPIALAGAQNLHRWRLETIRDWLRKQERTPHVPTLRGKVRYAHLATLHDEEDEDLPPPPRPIKRVRASDPDEGTADEVQS